MLSKSVRILLLALLLLGTMTASGCKSGGTAPTPTDWTREQARALRLAGEQLGVPVRAEGMVQFAQGGAVLFVAPAANLESIPATRYSNGVDLGASYLDLPGRIAAPGEAGVTVPKGYYKLRAFADDVRQVGKVGGHVQLIDASGRTVAELPADMEIRSLTLPPEAATQKTIPSVNSEQQRRIIICFRCSNGVWVCFVITLAL